MTGHGAAQGDVRLDRHPDHDRVAILTLDRPAKRNALTLSMVRELDQHTRDLQADPSIRAVVLTGAGDRAFCAGGDLASLIPGALAARADILNPDPTRRFLSGLDKPVVAAVRGSCFGAGLEMLLGADIRVAGDDCVFGLPETAIGLIPGDGTHLRLPQQVPMAVAREMILLGTRIDANRAYAVGLVNEVVPPDRVLDRAVEIAVRLTELGPVAVQTSKQILARLFEDPRALALEHALNARVIGSADAQEGVAAARERRMPRFEGR